MPSLEELQSEIETIKQRNQRVEADKAWETSWARRFIILIQGGHFIHPLRHPIGD